MFTDFSSEIGDLVSGDDLSTLLSTSLPQKSSISTHIGDKNHLLSSLSTSRTTSSLNELSFDCQSSTESSSMITVNKETATRTTFIRHKWIDEKDILFPRLISDLRKPDIGNIAQWESLIKGDDVDLDNFLPQEKRKIQSFADWTVAFTSFRKAVLYIFTHRHAELDTHFERIANMCRASHSIKSVLLYEADIRRHVAKMPHLSLFDDFSFLASKYFTKVQSTILDETPGEQKQICRNYNSCFKRCKLKKCPRLHICSICFNAMQVQMTHSAANCRTSLRNHHWKTLSSLAFSINRLPISSRRHLLPYDHN